MTVSLTLKPEVESPAGQGLVRHAVGRASEAGALKTPRAAATAWTPLSGKDVLRRGHVRFPPGQVPGTRAPYP